MSEIAELRPFIQRPPNAEQEPYGFWLSPAVTARVTYDQIVSVAHTQTTPQLRVDEMRARVHSADEQARRSIAQRFSNAARKHPGVEAVYTSDFESTFRVTALTNDLSLDGELALRAVFVDLVRTLPDPSVGHLTIMAADDPDADQEFLGELVSLR